MAREDEEDNRIYRVVVNHDEQYSIWPADRKLPLGWNEVGKEGTKQECLAYIQQVWTDMRPASLRQRMEEAERLLRENEGGAGSGSDTSSGVVSGSGGSSDGT